MISLLLVAHAPIASAMLEGALHIFPDLPQIVAHDVISDASNSEKEELIRKLHTLNNPEGVLILNDIHGATPYNLCLELFETPLNHPLQLITGLSLPLLLKAITYRYLSMPKLTETLQAGVSKTVTTYPPTHF